MREFLCRPNTKHAGIHNIYDSVEEFRKYFPETKLYKWSEGNCLESEPGDWVQAEDGFIVQILERYTATNKVSHRPTYAFRFPMGTFGVYVRMDGTIRFPLFYAQFTNGNKTSLSGLSSSYRSNDYAKVRFAAMILAGMDPRQALRVNFQAARRFLTQHQIETKIIRLFMDEVVRKEIRKSVEAFKDDIKQRISMADIIEKITKHWNNVKPGSSQELAAINFMMEIHDVLVVDEVTRRKKVINKGDIEEAQFKEDNEPAPQLGQSDD